MKEGMKHPIIGKLTPLQTLTFLDAHLAHHARQIGRLWPLLWSHR